MSYFQADFIFNQTPGRVRFGPGVRNDIRREIEGLGCSRVLILSTPSPADVAMEFAELAKEYAAGVFTQAQMHTPVEISDDATAYAKEIDADCIVSVGGGSTIGLGKAIAWRTGLPQIVLPTTYAGSEATPILGQTEEGHKTTLSSPKVLPEVILYDAELIQSLPRDITVTSAFNAMAHAAEALYARNKNPISTILAVEGLSAFRSSLHGVVVNPNDLIGRGETLYGAWLCGTVLGQVGMSLHHKLCHTLGGSFNLPHAQTHTIVLPHAIHFNEKVVSEQLQPIVDLFGGESAGRSLHQFANQLNAPVALKDLGMKEEDLNACARIASSNPYWNPRPVTYDSIRALLQAAWNGDEPAV